VPITFICPQCHINSNLYEIEQGIVEQRSCNGAWQDDDTPESDHDESFYDNAVRHYECSNCQYEPEIEFANGETLRSWIARHQSDPPGLLKDFLSVTQQIEINKQQQLDPGPMVATIEPPLPVDVDVDGNPELLP